MRASDPPVYYLVGTPKGRLTKLEADLLERPWQSVRPGVEVKVLPQEQELYLFAQSRDRLNKERAMRRRQLKALWKRLGQLQQMKLKARPLLLKLGEAKGRYPVAWRLLELHLPDPATEGPATFRFALDRPKLRQVRRREGRYLLRSNLCGREPAQLWQFYMQLVEIEAAFKNLKGDLVLRPLFHRLEQRIEAHIFVAFMAYCLQRELAGPTAAPGPGPDPPRGAGQIRLHPDARRAFADHRRPYPDLEPLHPTGAGPPTSFATTQAHPAGPTPAAPQRPSGTLGARSSGPFVVQTFGRCGPFYAPSQPADPSG
jgi:hypothetical protein